MYLFAVVVFTGMITADNDFNWGKYHETYNLFGNFWDDANPLFKAVDTPGATCGEVFGHNATWVISACRKISGVSLVRSGCFWGTQVDPVSWQNTYGILQSPCPNGMYYCKNVGDDSFFQVYPQMHAKCS